MEEPAPLSRHICGEEAPMRRRQNGSVWGSSPPTPPPGLSPTCVCAAVILQVPGGGELLAAVLLLAGERLLAVVSAHVDLQPLQHVEALPAALGAAPEHPVVPG